MLVRIALRNQVFVKPIMECQLVLWTSLDSTLRALPAQTPQLSAWIVGIV